MKAYPKALLIGNFKTAAFRHSATTAFGSHNCKFESELYRSIMEATNVEAFLESAFLNCSITEGALSIVFNTSIFLPVLAFSLIGY